VYEATFGKKINIAKTTIFLSKNTGRAFQNNICSLVGVAATKGYDKYLGLPTLVGHS
jgi:hypothetical protein